MYFIYFFVCERLVIVPVYQGKGHALLAFSYLRSSVYIEQVCALEQISSRSHDDFLYVAYCHVFVDYKGDIPEDSRVFRQRLVCFFKISHFYDDVEKQFCCVAPCSDTVFIGNIRVEFAHYTYLGKFFARSVRSVYGLSDSYAGASARMESSVFFFRNEFQIVDTQLAQHFHYGSLEGEEIFSVPVEAY